MIELEYIKREEDMKKQLLNMDLGGDLVKKRESHDLDIGVSLELSLNKVITCKKNMSDSALLALYLAKYRFLDVFETLKSRLLCERGDRVDMMLN
jgi:hypothetical protein